MNTQHKGNVTTTHTYEGQEVRPFGNTLSQIILWAIIVLLLGGLLVAFLGSFWGVAMTCIGVIIGLSGLTKFENSKPRTVGLVTVLGVPRKIGDKYPLVGGTTVLLPWLGIGAIPIPIERSDKNIPMTATCRGTGFGNSTGIVELKGEFSGTIMVNLDDLEDFIDSGGAKEKGLEKIWEDLDDIIVNAIKTACGTKTWIYIIQHGNIIGEAIRKKILDGKSFGVTLYKLQVTLNAPPELIEAALQVEIENQQKQAVLIDNETLQLAADMLLKKLNADPATAGKHSLAEAIGMIQAEEQINKGRTFLLNTSGGSGNLSVATLNVVTSPEQARRGNV